MTDPQLPDADPQPVDRAWLDQRIPKPVGRLSANPEDAAP